LISSIALVVLNSKKHSIQFYFDVKELLPFLKVGSYSMGSRLVSFFSTDIDILIIGKTMGPASLGLYSLSKQLILKLYSIINPIITNVLSPLLSSIQDDPKRLKRYYLKVVALISTVNIPIYLIVVVLSSEILAIVYGLEYTEAKNILSSLALVYCINSISNPVGSLQIATGRTDIGLKWAIFSLIVTPVVIYFASKFDINTVAFSRAILSLVMMIPLWFIQLRPMANIGLKEYLSQFYKPLLFFLTATLFVYLMGNKTEITDNIVANVIIKTVTISLTFSGFVIIFDKKAVLETFHLFISTVNVKGTK
jgi:O-antigen/teichoic acid export membrane protein